jgi:hypothetical protein
MTKLTMVEKSITLFGKEVFRVERNRLGEFRYSFLNGTDFNNSEKFLDMSLKNPVLMTICALRSKIYSQMRIEHINAQGNVIENSKYTKLLQQPNYFQSQEDFLFQQMWFLSATGNDYVYQIKPLRNELPKALYNLVPSEIDFEQVHKINKFLLSKEDIKKCGDKTIKYTLDNKVYDIKLSEIIPFYDLANGITNNSFMRSESRIKGVSKIVQNIDENLKAKYTNLQMSQKYIGKNQSDGNEGQIQAKDRSDIEKSVVKNSLVLTNANIDVKHLVSDMKKLYLDEQYADDANKILLAFEMNKNVLNYFSKDSTFENQVQGVIYWIQNSIQTSADNFVNSLSSQWGLFEKGEKLVATFDHLPLMQQVVNEKISSFKTMQEVIKLSLENGTLSTQEAKKMSDSFRLKLKL